MRIDAKIQKALIWAFLIMSTIYSTAYVLLLDFWPPVPASLNPDEIAQLYRSHNVEFRAGVVLMMLTGGFMGPLTIVLSAQMARIESGYPLLSKLQLLAGALGTWLFAFPPFLWGVAAFSPDRDPAITAVIHEMAWLAFVTPPSFFVLQVLPIAVASFIKGNDAKSPFPRWFGYLSFWMEVSGAFGVMAMMFKIGPFAWNGWFSFYIPLVAFLVWLVCLVVLLFKAIRLQEEGGT